MSDYIELAGFLVPIQDILKLLGESKHVLIEVPLGMRELGIELTKYLLNNGFDAIMSGRSVWGSCDFLITRDYDAVLHVGHALPPNIKRIINENYGIKEFRESGEVSIMRLGNDETVIFTPAYYRPHEDLITHIINKLEGLTPHGDFIIAYSLPYRLYAERISRTLNARLAPSAITGCFIGYPIPSTVFFVGGGYFYPLTFKLLRSDVKVYLVDIFRQIVEDIEPIYRRTLALKVNNIQRVLEGKKMAIVITRKPGQRRIDLMREAQSILKELNKEFIVVESDEISPDAIDNLLVDGVINTACPRIGIDDLDRFIRPVVNVRDLTRRDLEGNLLGW